MSDLALCPRSILEIRPRSLSSLYPCDSTSPLPSLYILVSSSLQGRLSSLLLISLRPSFYPCFRPRYKDASRPSFLTSNCFRPIPTHIFFHEQYSAEGWPSLASVDQGSKTKCMRPCSYVTQGHVRAALLLRNARTMFVRPCSYVTQGRVRVRPRRCVSPRTLALPPSDWRDSWASEGHAFDIKTLVWLETGELEIRHGIETRSQTPSKAMSIFTVGQRLFFCCILIDNKGSNCNLISDSKLCSYGSQLCEIYDKGNLTSPLTQSNNQRTRPRSPHP